MPLARMLDTMTSSLGLMIPLPGCVRYGGRNVSRLPTDALPSNRLLRREYRGRLLTHANGTHYHSKRLFPDLSVPNVPHLPKRTSPLAVAHLGWPAYPQRLLLKPREKGFQFKRGEK